MDLKLTVLLGMIDRATAPLRAIGDRSAATAKALRDTRQRLKELSRVQEAVQGFRELKAGTEKLGAKLRETQQRATTLGKRIADSGVATEAQAKAFDSARKQAAVLGRKYEANTRQLQAMRQSLGAAGVDTKNLSQHERRLRDDLAGANRQLDLQQSRLQQLTAQQRRASAARQAYERAQATGAHLAIGGLAAMTTGQHLLGSLRPVLDEAKAFQLQMAQLRALGIGDAMVSDATKFARGLDVMGTSATDNLKLLKESYSVLRDMHEAEQVTPYLARMKFGIETVMAQAGHGEGHGEHAETMFMDLLKVAELRGAAKNPESLKRVLDFATQSYVASGGLVKPEDMLNMIKTGGVAAKQLDDSTFFFGLLHTMQEMGGHRAGTGLATAYQNWAAGRSTQQSAEELAQLGLLKPGAAVYGTTGHLKKVLPDGLKDGALYRSNPYQFLLDKVIPKLNPTGALNDQQVVSKINALFSGRKGGDLFASLFMERANIAKHLAAAPKAYGVEALYREATQTAQGQEAELLAKKADLYRELGTQLLPLYVSALGKLVGVLRSLNGWAQRHPQLAKGLVVVAASFGVLLSTVGAVMVALGGLVGQFALLRFALRMGGLRLGALFGRGAAAGEGAAGWLSRLPRLFPMITTGARAAMLAITGVSAPVALLLAALVAAAVLVHRYWQPIAAWLQGVGQGIAQTLGPVLAKIGTALAPLKPAWDAITGGIATVWHWLMQLLAPFQATREQLDGARQNGVAFGRVVGLVLGGVVQAVTAGLRAFVWLGESIGIAAGWVAVHWGPVGAWFASLWSGIQSAASAALDWIQRKLDAVRGVIDQLTAAWRQLHGDTVPAMGQAPVQWIMPKDTERAHRIAETIGRTPLPGAETPATASGSSAITNAPPISARGMRSVQVAGDTVTVHVDARGSDPVQTQRAVRDALAQHAREKQARARSAYTDED